MKLGAAILAGGKNSRMKGQNKAFLDINGVSIIDRGIEVLKKRFNEITIVTNSPENYLLCRNDCAIVTDIIKDKGPLCGIHAGLVHTSKDGVFFIACDMPFLHIGLINRLVEIAGNEDFDCVVPYSDRGIEPLHAVYSKNILPELEKSLYKEGLPIRQYLERCKCKYVKARPEELSSFININATEELREMGLNENKI